MCTQISLTHQNDRPFLIDCLLLKYCKNCQHCLNINILTSSINCPLYWISGIDMRYAPSGLVMKRPSHTFSTAQVKKQHITKSLHCLAYHNKNMLTVCVHEEQGKLEKYAVALNRVFLKVGKIN